MTQFEKLKAKLAELFQLDQADLDFGIYRIMNARRDEITQFLDKDLLPQVQEAFGQYAPSDKAEIQKQLDEVIAGVKAAGMNPDDAPKVKELRARLADDAVDLTALENEVYSRLYDFFNRYYDEGDFISLRRYKEGVYAIPYEGEEVKLHWANSDQYYVKTTENFRDYAFKTADGHRVHLKIIEADTEKDNIKAANGNDRRFILRNEESVAEEDGELVIRFEYRPDGEKRKQDAINEEAVNRIMESLNGEELAAWQHRLGVNWARADGTASERTILEKHLSDYTKRNTFDYFIHKDLDGFLRRELDFYIKNEVMHLDDVESESAPRVEQYLSKIKVIRQIAHKIIDFLAQIENFQKKLWLKKKFVVETNYCITLDRIPEELYEEISANDAQREEWKHLFAIDALTSESNEKQQADEQEKLFSEPSEPPQAEYSEPLTVDFLKENRFLVLDTKFFSENFKCRLLGAFENLDSSCNGLLVHSDNFQGLNLALQSYSGQAKCIYIDPPYNTDVSSIPYKNDYRHSSWGTMMRDRLVLLRELLKIDGAIFVSIDKAERMILGHALDSVFGTDNKVEELIWVQNTNDGRSPTYSTNHEYVEVYAKSKMAVERDADMFREPKPGYTEVAELVDDLNRQYPPLSEVKDALLSLYEDHKRDFRESVEARGLDWDVEKRNDPWKGLYPYKFAEYRDDNGEYLPEDEGMKRRARLWVFRESDWTIMSAESKQSASTRDPNHPNHRYYQPVHPLTGKPCRPSTRGWKGTQYIDPAHPERNSLESLMNDHRIAFGEDENKVPQQKRFLHEVETNVCKSVFVDYSDGEKQTAAMFGKSGVFLAPKHTNFVERFILQSAKDGGVVVDCFGGSGSTGDAVIKLNRIDDGNRKYVLVEMGDHFNTILKPRIQKTVYAKTWLSGKPVTRDGISHMFKYIRLESYEDALANIRLKRTDTQQSLLDGSDSFRESYMLGYMLDTEAAGSASLLNIDAFEDPFNYKLLVGTGSVGETKPVNVDLVETFNWLLGLRVKHMSHIRGIRIVEGENPKGEKVLVIWRNVKETSNEDLEEFFRKQQYNTLDMEFDLVYVNGDNNLMNIPVVPEDQGAEPRYKVRLIEEEFKRLMFDVKDV